MVLLLPLLACSLQVLELGWFVSQSHFTSHWTSAGERCLPSEVHEKLGEQSPCVLQFRTAVDKFIPCGQQKVTHNVEHVRLASSTKGYGNSPNRRNLGVWYAEGKRFETPKAGRRGPGGAGAANKLVE